MRRTTIFHALSRVGAVAVAAALLTVPTTSHVPVAVADEVVATDDAGFRRQFGLRSDPEYVEQVRAAWRNGAPTVTDELGVPLTATEFGEIDYRQQVIADDAPLIRSRVRGDLLGGLFMDNKNGGMLTVAVTRDAARVLGELRSAVRHPSRLRVVHARRSLGSLEATKDRIFAARLTAPPGIVITKASVDEPANLVRIGVAGDPAVAQAHFDAMYGRGLVVVTREDVRPAGTQAVDSPPFRGGQRIDDTGGYSCTSGFVAYRNTVPVSYYVLSAAHCGPVGDAWRQAGVVLLGQTDRVDNSIADTMRVPIAATAKSNQVTINYSSYLGQGTYRTITSSQGVAADVVGETECSSGQNTTSLQCGALLAKSVDYSWTTWYGASASFQYGREADFDCNPGDSGGSVLYGNQARGILSAKVTRTFGNDTCIYGHIYDNLRGVGVTGVVTTQ